MFTIRKEFTFEAAHQLEGAFTEACHRCVHGHSYKVELVLASDAHLLNHDFMVIDFGELKAFKEEVMKEWDHGVLFHQNKRPHIQPLIDAGIWAADKVHFLEDNPTAETMAALLFWRLQDFIKTKLPSAWERGVSTIKVRVHETATGWAEYAA